MPLAFQSLSHGEVAFGFFNIESDMILLNNYCFFTGDFCKCVGELAKAQLNSGSHVSCDMYVLRQADMGNLMGAIAGIDLSGFIGDVYNLFPFPHEPDRFKQNPEAWRTREQVEGIIRKYAGVTQLVIATEEDGHAARVGEYRFSRAGFHELIRYLWVGGYPTWDRGEHPAYVLDMKECLEDSENPLFSGVSASLR